MLMLSCEKKHSKQTLKTIPHPQIKGFLKVRPNFGNAFHTQPKKNNLTDMPKNA